MAPRPAARRTARPRDALTSRSSDPTPSAAPHAARRFACWLAPPLLALAVALGTQTSRHAAQTSLPAPPRSAAPHDLPAALSRLAAARRPHLLAAAPVVPRWTPSRLRQVNFSRVYSNTFPRFGPYYDEARPMARLPHGVFRGAPRHGYVETELGGAAFFGEWAEGRHGYYSGEIERDLPPPLRDELAPLERVLVSLRPERSSVNLWLGRRLASAPCHYDGYHNAFSQLHGRKRFVLAPPNATELLRPFPFLHPSHAQCQAHLPSIPPAELLSAGAMEVELQPGDILYLPPLWFHETVALGDSISVNGWSDSVEADAASALFAQPRPPRPPGGDDAASAARLMCFLSTAFGDEPCALARQVWRERYEELASSGEISLEWGGIPRPTCDSIGARLMLSTERQRAADGGEAPAEAWAAQVARHANDGIPASSLPIWLGNLLELIAAEYVGVARVAPLLEIINTCS
ncbi:hypothetical protein AB1Y20_010324 [Prymnesium parvum]|uniref:JmjC domain-containing protein n=1 Tax=Prymnesium parvum TaxID=97485 RepID=A0AB34K728_PRYPA